MTSNSLYRLALFGVVAAALVSGYALTFRFAAERENRAVEIVAEFDQIEALAAAQGLGVRSGLEALKERGLIGVVLSEQTIGSLSDEGEILLRSEPAVPGETDAIGPSTLIAATNRETALRVASAIRASFPGARFVPPNAGEDTLSFLVEGVSPALLRTAGAGLRRLQAETASSLGLDIVVRFANAPGGPATIDATLRGAKALGARVFLPVGEQVLGRRDNLGALADALRANGMLYASPEFAKIGGDANIVVAAPEIVVRLHAAQAAELDKMTLGDAVERYSRAASERNMRLLLLRPIGLSAEKPLDAFGEFVSIVGKQLRREGLEPKLAHPFTVDSMPAWLRPAVAVLSLPVLAYVIVGLFSSLWIRVVGLLGCLGVAALSATDSGKPYAALAIALAFPIAAFLFLESWPRLPLWARYLLASLVSLAGGLCVAAMFVGVPSMVRAEQFEGVKLAHFAPVAVVGAWFFLRFGGGRESLRSPVSWTQALLGFAALGALGFMMLRTGNENPAAVSGLELKLRSVLDQLLLVRPRTKELLLGHPFMIVGLALLALRERLGEAKGGMLGGWAALALAVGAIGQTSIVNTMCHLHTPLTVSLTRVGVGLVLGGILGGFFWAGLRRLLPKTEG